MNGSDDAQVCPVCAKHTAEDALNSQQVIIQGMRSIMNRDMPAIDAIYSALTQYDAHVAITLLLMTLQNLGGMLGMPLEVMLDNYQGEIRAEQAAEASQE